jgi:hypothetical protein
VFDGLVGAVIGSFEAAVGTVVRVGCPDQQPPRKNAEGDALQDGTNWIPSFAQRHWSA